MAVGVWLGTTPLFGLHAAIALYLAWRLHLHPAAVVLGSQVSMPPLGIALAAGSTILGHVLLTGQITYQPPIHNGVLLWLSAPLDLLPAWVLGSSILGFFLGLGTFFLVLFLATPKRNDGPNSIDRLFQGSLIADLDHSIEPDQLNAAVTNLVDHSGQGLHG